MSPSHEWLEEDDIAMDLAAPFRPYARPDEFSLLRIRVHRVYHALKASHGGTQLHFFVDIEEATRSQMLVSLVNRREQMVSDGLMLNYDQDHWNSVHITEEPIQLPMDLTFERMSKRWGAVLRGHNFDLQDWREMLKPPFEPWIEVHGMLCFDPNLMMA